MSDTVFQLSNGMTTTKCPLGEVDYSIVNTVYIHNTMTILNVILYSHLIKYTKGNKR